MIHHDGMPRVIMQEIFSGIQGEGVWVGARQIFVRFHGCHVACRYCDTPAAHAPPPVCCTVETAPGARTLMTLPNPLTVAEVVGAVQRLEAGMRHQAVSLTGGEPLLHRAFLDALLPRLHDLGLATYLETNGLLPTAMAALATPPRYIAMDLKLPSVAGIVAPWAAHRAFLEAAIAQLARAGMDARQHLQVKIVFGEDSLGDLPDAAAIFAGHDDLPCILQPLTPGPTTPNAPTPATVLEAQRLLAATLNDVRVIPQTHVLLRQW